MSDQEIGCSRMYFVAVEDDCKQKVDFWVKFLVNVFLSGITFLYILIYLRRDEECELDQQRKQGMARIMKIMKR